MCVETECSELQDDSAAVPTEAAMILTALEAAGGRQDRRQCARTTYRYTATFSLFADAPGASARVLYTRDINERGIGFITRERLPLGYGGLLRLPAPQGVGGVLNIPCTLYRCRLAAPGWYEGALHFNRDQTEFFPTGAKPIEDEPS